MSDIKGTKQGQPSQRPRKGVRSRRSTLSFDPQPTKSTPTERLESARNEQVGLLDEERRRLLKKVDALQVLVDRLAPENARLKEALGNTMANNILATILVAIGGGGISLAPFLEGWSRLVASGEWPFSCRAS
jgi:hypothetical protein